MLSRNAWLATLACLLASLTGCAPIGFGRQELTLRHDAPGNAIELSILYDAIRAQKDEAEVGLGFATRVSTGARELMIFDWPMHFVLDDIKQKVDEEATSEVDPWQEWKRDLVGGFKGVKVTSSGYYRDEGARLGLYQCLRISEATHWVFLFERALYLGIEVSLSKGTFDTDFEFLDARTRELWVSMLKDRRGWLSLKDETLTVDLPITGACASRLLGRLLEESASEEVTGRFFAGLFSHLTEMKIADEHVVLRWKLDGPTWTFAPPRDDKYDGKLAQSLRESNALPEKLPSREKVIASLPKR